MRIWDELVWGGFAGVNIDAEFGGGGQLSDLVVVAGELARAT